jgi:hypothetical protein
MKINLLEETIAAIAQSGHTEKDIKFIGSPKSGHACSWNEFTILANQEYENGYGAQYVAMDLVIIFNDDSWLKRDEYDGSEGWKFFKNFEIPSDLQPITTLFSIDGWDTLEGLNNDESE